MPGLKFEKVLGAMNSEAAFILKERGFTQNAIAYMLGLTQPAISHYLNGSRGVGIVTEEDKKAISDIIDSTSSLNDMGFTRIDILKLSIRRFEAIKGRK